MSRVERLRSWNRARALSGSCPPQRWGKTSISSMSSCRNQTPLSDLTPCSRHTERSDMCVAAALRGLGAIGVGKGYVHRTGLIGRRSYNLYLRGFDAYDNRIFIAEGNRRIWAINPRPVRRTSFSPLVLPADGVMGGYACRR